tara:strand:+ start:1599 stop:3467 length:1869 start_codon:yes stop_codon:yes gene_type:complete
VNIHKLLDQAEQAHRQGQLQKAQGLYKEILKQRPEQADALYGLGTILLQQSQPQAARNYLRKATKILPNSPEFLFNLALAEELSGDKKQAVIICLEAAHCTLGFDALLLKICQKLVVLGCAAQAMTYLKRMPSENLQVLLVQAQAYVALEEWGGALNLLDRLTGDFPDNGLLWRQCAQAAAHMRDFDHAITAYSNYLSCVNATGQDFLGQADLYYMARRPRETKIALEKAFALGGDGPDAYFLAAKCARLEGAGELAKENLMRAIEVRPTFGAAWELLFELSDKSDLDSLVERCHSAQKKNSDKLALRDKILLPYALGHAYEKMARYRRAFKAFSQANRQQELRISGKGASYNPEETALEFSHITSCYRTGVQYPVAEARSGPRPIFIVGMPRSGTTLIEKIIGCLNGVSQGGEHEALEFVSRQYYRNLAQNSQPAPDFLKPEELNEMADVYWRKTPSPDEVITDKMPHNFRHVGLIMQLFPDARVLYMKRDPRDVCLSIYSRLFPDVHNYATDLDNLAHFTAHAEKLNDHWKEIFPERYREVVYEDLVNNSEEVSQDIASFCDLEWHAGCLEFHKLKVASYTFSELQVRKPLNKAGIGRWRKYEAYLHPLIKALSGYGLLK